MYPAAMPGTFELERQVQRADIDELGHVGNTVFLTWLIEAATAHSTEVGLGWSRYRELGGVFVVRRHELDYLAPAFVDELLRIRTWIGATSRVTSIRHYEVRRGEICLVRAQTRWAFVSLDSGRPTRIPEQVRRAFELP